ncbi:MAG TPA: nucleotidyltransferase family protein [Polyangiaceae bacterium]|nr:nucleotidyltransferase family protein [Polyangiaceae bacterium]
MKNLTSPDDRSLSAIVLAAGLSRRMGGRNKLLLPLSGAPLVVRSVATLVAVPFAEVVVVTGYEAAKVEAALASLPVRFARNPHYAVGQMTSVRTGLEALAKPTKAVMVCLADQPLLTSQDIAAIAAAFFDRPGCSVLVPTFDGMRGNPIVLARESVDEILARGANFGCKHFVSQNADLVTTAPMATHHVLVDLDRPEDYAALTDSTTAQCRP